MKNYLYLIFLVLSSPTLFAQNIGDDIMLHQRVKGYIVQNNGDTLHGKIVVPTRAKSQLRIWFINDEEQKKTYRAKDEEIIAYGFQTKNGQDSPLPKWRHFQLKTADQPPSIFATKIVFLEVKATGTLTLYNFYVQMNTNPESLYKHYYFLDGLIFDFEKVTTDNFDEIVSRLGQNCSMVRRQSGQLSFYDLDRIVHFYNDCQENKAIEDISKGGKKSN